MTGEPAVWVAEIKGTIRLEALGSRPGASSPSNALSPGSWQDYYTWRGLSLDSPMAVLLTYPLTVYYVITHLVPQSCKESGCRGRSATSRAAGSW